MNKVTITKEELQWQVVDSWIQEGVLFTELKREEMENINKNIVTFPHWTYQYKWQEDTKIYQWAKETLESDEKLVAEAYPEGYEVTVISGNIQKTYIVGKSVREK